MQSHLQGKIEFCDLKKKKCLSTYIVQSHLKEISMSETFMSNFCNLGLSPDEKQQLSQENRREIIHYQSITLEEIESFVNQFVLSVKSNRSEVISVDASGFGAYICLTAIITHKLPKNKRYQFTLEGMPIKVFPKKFIKSKKLGHNIEVSYIVKDRSWLKSFSSLTALPECLNHIDQLIDLKSSKRTLNKVA